ncbi:MAG: cytoplasmic protein [Lachnospiraceae bacterium]|nr:cytoplasmic protein [Lachnospiraceae bacterium]MCI9590289.1 cytoplasmic protein [Lachnospiraceae bacterium]
MITEKKYAYTYEDYEEQGKDGKTMVTEILSDPDFPELKKIIIGCWGWAAEDGCQPILDGIVENREQFSGIEELFVGDMDFEECEVSWIIQGNYSRLWEAMPGLRELTIKGSTDLTLGNIRHDNLESLTIICGGLPESVIKEIEKAKLPNLKKLLLYIGSDNYGFDGNEDTIKSLLDHMDFPNLEYLGIADSEIQDQLAEVVLKNKIMGQLHTLDLSCGTLTDKGGALILETVPQYPNLEKLDVHYHFMTKDMVKKLQALPVEVDASDANQPDEYDGEIYLYAMLTE